MSEKCEYCGRFGARKVQIVDKYGYNANRNGYTTYHVCRRCEHNINEDIRKRTQDEDQKMLDPNYKPWIKRFIPNQNR